MKMDKTYLLKIFIKLFLFLLIIILYLFLNFNITCFNKIKYKILKFIFN